MPPDIYTERDRKLVLIANEFKRGLLTEQDYLDRTIDVVLSWLVKEGSNG